MRGRQPVEQPCFRHAHCQAIAALRKIQNIGELIIQKDKSARRHGIRSIAMPEPHRATADKQQFEIGQAIARDHVPCPGSGLCAASQKIQFDRAEAIAGPARRISDRPHFVSPFPQYPAICARPMRSPVTGQARAGNTRSSHAHPAAWPSPLSASAGRRAPGALPAILPLLSWAAATTCRFLRYRSAIFRQMRLKSGLLRQDDRCGTQGNGQQCRLRLLLS